MPLHPYSQGALRKNVKGKSSQWAELWVIHLTIHFKWKKKLPEVQIYID